MARITKTSITLCALLLTTFSFTPLAYASNQANLYAGQKTSLAKKAEPQKTATKSKEQSQKVANKKASPDVKPTTSSSKSSAKQTAAVNGSEKCTPVKGQKPHCVKVKSTKADGHKTLVKKAQTTAVSKLMGQIGKPYHWGGTSPQTGFDCSGLVYYAYKGLVKFNIPRTANEMYHLRDAAPVNRSELESGDLVFFRTRGKGAADHVGVYVGNGKFIQSPRSGQEIQITSLSEDYWQRHYIGARRVMTPTTIR